MRYFLLDASALVKRYYSEIGTPLLNHLFTQSVRPRLMCLWLGAAKVFATLVRKRNGGLLTPSTFAIAARNLEDEVLRATDFAKIPSDDALIAQALPLIERHSLNASDAILLNAALEQNRLFQTQADELVLVGADQRLLRAAQAEGLLTFDPEHQDQLALNALLGP